MTQELTKPGPASSGVLATYDRNQLDLLKRTVCKGATDDEFMFFMNVAKSTGLDPFRKQIHAVKRWDSKSKRNVMAIQTGIDGYRLIADRTQRYAPGPDHKLVFGEGGALLSATAMVKKKVGDEWHEVTATAYFEEYVQKTKDGNPNRMWKTMPKLMLGKCAEALALRKAFPAELSGVYTNEEMTQVDNTAPGSAAPAGAKDAEPADLAGTSITFTPVDVKAFKGKSKAGKAYEIYTVFDEEGREYKTFDKELAGVAKSAVKKNEIVLHFKQTKFGLEIEDLEVKQAAGDATEGDNDDTPPAE